ncbi:MAG: type II secretion system protein GspL [Gallionella sp.]
MSTLYLHLPSIASVQNTDAQDPASHRPADNFTLPCQFAIAQGVTVTQQGTASLSELSGAITVAKRIVLIVSASDTTLLRIQVPPLSPAKLKAALPNLVEEQLIGDPANNLFVAGKATDNLRSIAVIQRTKIESLVKQLNANGAQQIKAVPAQLCLPSHPDSVFAAIHEQHGSIELTIRLSEHEGMGLRLDAEPEAAISSLCTLAHAAEIELTVPQASVHIYENIVNNSNSAKAKINVSADNWSHWIAGAESASIDLMSGMSNLKSAAMDYRAWRWPLALAALVMLVNITALNMDWWHMKREADMLRSSMFQTYQAAYPDETVIIDPIAQMRQKIDIAKRNTGQASSDDFTILMTNFNKAWSGAVIVPITGKENIPAISAIEYRDNSLLVKLKLGARPPTQKIKSMLAGHGMTMEITSSQSSGETWEIRRAL